jgi:hypothetical protein
MICQSIIQHMTQNPHKSTNIGMGRKGCELLLTQILGPVTLESKYE